MTTKRERVLSEFIDAWNAGQRPDVDAYLERVDEADRAPLADELATFLTWAPEPDYDSGALAAIRSEPIVREAMASASRPAGLWPALLPRLRRRAALSVSELAGRLTEALSLPAAAVPKTEMYLGQMESGRLDTTRVSRRLLDALGRVLGVDAAELEAADVAGGAPPMAAPAPLFRADVAAGGAIRDDLEVLADALAAPAAGEWDDVDQLFRGGR